jgi:hypothetical protein
LCTQSIDIFPLGFAAEPAGFSEAQEPMSSAGITPFQSSPSYFHSTSETGERKGNRRKILGGRRELPWHKEPVIMVETSFAMRVAIFRSVARKVELI